MIINLVGNAIKFTQQGGVTLRLDVKAEREEAPWLVIEVEDTGIGIGPEDQARIFDAFVQVGKTSNHKGTGLGLAISRQFVQLMGGNPRRRKHTWQGLRVPGGISGADCPGIRDCRGRAGAWDGHRPGARPTRLPDTDCRRSAGKSAAC